MSIHHVTGDASKPEYFAGPIILAHVVNNLGKWGKGFTASLDRRWPQLKAEYKIGLVERELVLGENGVLGQVMYSLAEPGMVVAHMVAQNGVSRVGAKVVDYNALARCLCHVRAEAIYTGASVHMPRIGAGLGGGEWVIIEQLILGNLVNAKLYDEGGLLKVLPDQREVEVYVYTLGGA